MANDLNQCSFIGRLGKDPEVRYLPSGQAVCNFQIAVSEQWKDKDGQKQERTTWVPFVAFEKQAEICGEYLRKGSRIYASGKFTVRKWQDQSGNDRYSTEVRLERMQMLDGKRDDSGQSQESQADYEQRAARTPPASAGGGGVAPADFIDDIPFIQHERGSVA